jgi:Tol biopolymer transport system component
MQTVPNATAVGTMRWSPAGTSIVYDQTLDGGFYGGSSALYTVTPSGTVTRVDTSAGYEDVWPQWSRDGSTIYFSKLYGSATGTMWQVTPSGANDDSLASQSPSYDIFPSPSPDGSQLAYVTSGQDLRILTLATGAVTDLHIGAWAPVWSPTGSQIAFITSAIGQIVLVNSDGTGQRALTAASVYYQQDFDWSPDGKYIVALNESTGLLDLITVSTGETEPLSYTGWFYSPAWKPASGSSALRVPGGAPRAGTPFGRRRS